MPVVLFEYDQLPPKSSLLDGEILQFKFIKINTLKLFLKNQKINDGFTLSAIQLLNWFSYSKT